MKKFCLLILSSLMTVSASASATHELPRQKARAKQAENLRPLPPDTRLNGPKRLKGNVRKSNSAILNPEGEAKQYMQSASSYFAFWGMVMDIDDAGLAGEIVWDGNKVYMKNPLSQLVSDSYITGTLDGSEITFEFPQVLQEWEEDGESGIYYIDVLDYKYDEEEEAGWYYPSETKHTITFTIDANGILTMEDSNDADFILGLVEDDEWSGFGDWDIVFEPFNETVTTAGSLPDVSFDIWQFTSKQNDGIARVAISGNNVYLSGLSDDFANAVVTGTLDGNTANFPSRQYVGIDDDYNYRVFFDAVAVDEEYDEEWEEMIYYYSLIAEGGCFAYDAEKRTLESENDFALAGGREDNLEAYATFESPVFSAQPADISQVPNAPTDLDFDSYPELDMVYVVFTLPGLNIDGYVLNPDNLYYRVLVNNMPYTFLAEDYDLEEDLIDLPFELNDGYSIIASGRDRMLPLYGTPLDFELGIQIINKQPDATYESAITSANVVKVSAVDSTPATCNYFDLSGRLVSPQTKGMLLRQTIYPDGTKRTQKILVK